MAKAPKKTATKASPKAVLKAASKPPMVKGKQPAGRAAAPAKRSGRRGG